LAGKDKDQPEKICDSCGEPGAVVHLTQVVNNETKTSHLCEKCAAQKGIQASVPGSSSNLHLADFLAKMGGDDLPLPGSSEEDAKCPFCGLSAKDFREIGRLGCPQCYPTFEDYLRGLLRRIHGGTHHVGKVYLPPDPSASDREKRLSALKKKLERAVAAEDFERAANLRDEIRTLEPTR
jgi:protein arginine kinase activator